MIDIIKNWLRSRTTIEFIGLLEQLHNPDFKAVEFDRFMYEAGSNAFVLSPGKWIETIGAIGINHLPQAANDRGILRIFTGNTVALCGE